MNDGLIPQRYAKALYKFAIENITELKDRPKTHTKALVRDLSEYLKY